MDGEILLRKPSFSDATMISLQFTYCTLHCTALPHCLTAFPASLPHLPHSVLFLTPSLTLSPFCTTPHSGNISSQPLTLPPWIAGSGSWVSHPILTSSPAAAYRWTSHSPFSHLPSYITPLYTAYTGIRIPPSKADKGKGRKAAGLLGAEGSEGNPIGQW